MTDHTDIVERLAEDAADHVEVAKCCDCRPEDTVNWRHAENAKEAAAKITRLRAEAEALRKALSAIVDRDFTFFDGCVDRNTITYGEIQQARAAINATKGTT